MIDLNINSEKLDELDNAIDKARDELADKGDILAEAEYVLTIKKEKEIFNAKYSEKLSDITAKAKATMACEKELRDYMIADSKNKRAKMQLDKLIDRKDSVKEQNYNLRAQMKVFGN